MAISTSSYFSNSIVGTPQVAGELVDIYATDTNPKFAIGTKFERQDGSIFRYAAFGGACTAGQLLACVATDIGFVSVTSAIISTSSTYQMPIEPVGVYPNGVGSRFIVINTSAAGGVAVAANTYRGGYLAVGAHKNDGIYSAGQTYRIRTNTAVNNPANGLLRFELYDKLLVTITTSAIITVAGSKYNDLVPVSSTAASGVGVPVGVATNIQANGNFGWVQSKGPVGTMLDPSGGSSAGYIAVVGTGSVGSIFAISPTTILTSGSGPVVGIVLSASSGQTPAIVDVMLD